MYNFLKNYKIYLIAFLIVIGFYILNKVQGCAPNDGGTIITPLKTVTPSEQDRAVIPVGRIAIGVIKPKVNNRPNKWEKVDTKIIAHVDAKCNTCDVNYTQVDERKKFIGFDFEPKFLIGAVGGKMLLAYNQGIFRYERFTIDAFAGLPAIGAGLGFNLTNNLYLLGGVAWKYLSYEAMDQIDTYYIDLKDIGTVRPTIGIGFVF